MRKPSYLSSKTQPALLNGRSLVSGFMTLTAAASTAARGAPSRSSSARRVRAGSFAPAIYSFYALNQCRCRQLHGTVFFCCKNLPDTIVEWYITSHERATLWLRNHFLRPRHHPREALFYRRERREHPAQHAS